MRSMTDKKLNTEALRISELVMLRRSDVDVKGGQLQLIDETGHSGKAVKERRGLKSGRSRSFPIHPHLIEILSRRSKGHSFSTDRAADD